MRVEQAQVVKAPREQVFKAWTDYDAWHKFSTLFTRVTVRERAGTLVTAVVETELKGLTRVLGPFAKRQLQKLAPRVVARSCKIRGSEVAGSTEPLLRPTNFL